MIMSGWTLVRRHGMDFPRVGRGDASGRMGEWTKWTSVDVVEFLYGGGLCDGGVHFRPFRPGALLAFSLPRRR